MTSKFFEAIYQLKRIIISEFDEFWNFFENVKENRKNDLSGFLVGVFEKFILKIRAVHRS